MRLALRYFAALLGCLLVVLSSHQAYGLPAHRMVSLGGKVTPNTAFLDKGRAPRTLVVYDVNTWGQAHSRLLQTLRKDGHRISYHTLVPPNQVFPSLVDVDDNLLFDTIILSLSNTSTPSGVSNLSAKLIQFREKLGNVVVLGLSEPRVLQSFFERIGIHQTKLPRVRDHFHRLGADPLKILGRQSGASPFVLSPHVRAESIVFQGNPSTWVDTPAETLSGQPLASVSAVRSTCEIDAKRFISSHFPTGPVCDNTIPGSQLVLVAGHQSRDNSRAVITLSKKLCSDEFVTANIGNLAFCRELVQWTSQQRGVVDWSNLHHEPYTSHMQLSPRRHDSLYTINEDMRFSIDLHELQANAKTNGSAVVSSWGPVSAADRVQLEFTMIDPHWRLFFNVAQKTTVSPLSVVFKCPDRYGIFKSVVTLTTKGLSFIHLETLTPVRNYRHNDYERFIWCAVPYYMSTFIVLILVVVVSAQLIMQPSQCQKRVE